MLTENNTSRKRSLGVQDFLGDPRLATCLETLKEFQKKTPLNVSDIVDENGHQYVNLVQKGGGVLGVALVGYTHILEQAGIRFLRLAGTSAGAINTALMTVIDRKEDTKSEKILKIICDLKFFSFVDGHPVARWLIKNFITNKGFTGKLKSRVFLFLGLFAALIASDILLVGLEQALPVLHVLTVVSFVFTGFYVVLLAAFGFYISSLLKRLKNSGFGINPGDAFYDWLKKNMADYGVSTVTQLREKAAQPVPGIKLREGCNADPVKMDGDVTFIASELVTENKIQFPLMCDLFRPADLVNDLSPAGFVRASMAIPVFFESYFIKDIPVNHPEIQLAWQTRFEIDKPPSSTRFVDGGMLSNFPLSIFYNPDITTPALPTFGIDLDDTEPGNKEQDPAGWSPVGYLGRMFNTIRYYYDKDFMLKNKVYERGVGKVSLSEYNWLNFFMSDKDKLEMFIKGAQAATEFLTNFDWEAYKNDRINYARTKR
jgi:NTE family protein